MQVGQLATMTLQMAPSSVQETVTVTGEAPLINITTSTATANIDQRQMQELPLNGRNWLDLTLLAPGSRANTGGETPIPRSQTAFQINMDGQQVTNSVAGAGFGQPRFSRDSIAEFEFVTNRFDATQGRSMGVIVNAVTKSGTNTPLRYALGLLPRLDWAAKDPVENRVIPFSNQQVQHDLRRTDPPRPHSLLRQLRVRARAADRRLQRPVPGVQRRPVRHSDPEHGGVKVDFQFTPQTRLSSRVNAYTQFVPLRGAGGATTHPSGASQWWRTSSRCWNQFTQVLSNNKVNEIKAGYYLYDWDITSLASFRGGSAPELPWRHLSGDERPHDVGRLRAGWRRQRGAWRLSPDSVVGLQHRYGDEPAADHRAEDVAGSRRFHGLVRRLGSP